MMCRRAPSVVQNRPRGSSTCSVSSTAKLKRQRMDRLASVGSRAGSAFVHHAADVAVRHGASADRPLHVEQARFGLAAAEVHGDRTQPGVGHVLGLADAGAHGFLRLLQIDDAAAAHAAAAVPAEAQHAQRAVGFACGRSGRRSWWCRYPARRTGRSGNGAAVPAPPAARTAAVTIRRDMSFMTDTPVPEEAWQRTSLPPCGALPWRANPSLMRTAAPSCRLLCRRGGAVGAAVSLCASGSRAQHQPVRQAHVDHRQRTVQQRHGRAAIRINRSSATGGVAFRQHDVSAALHQQVPAAPADAHRGHHARCKAGSRVSASSSGAAACGRAGADHQRQLAELRNVLMCDDLAVAIDQHEFAVVLPDGEGPAFLQVHHDGAGQAAFHRRVLDPGQRLDALARLLDGKAEDRVPPVSPRARHAAAVPACWRGL